MKYGVVMPIGRDERGLDQIPGWPAIREAAHAAEESGLDSIWIFDHLLFRFGEEPTEGIHEAWTMLAALAAETRRVELGTVVLAMGFRNPALLAKMAATLEEVSGGRLILGVGCGWHQPEYDAFGFPFDHRVGRFDEALQIMVPLVREGRVDFAGRWQAAPNCEILPRYSRPDGRTTPILIAGKQPRMRSLVARYADAWNTAWLGPATQLEARLAPMRETLAEEGRDPASLEITVGVNVFYPGPEGPPADLPPNVLVGDVASLGAALREYEALGVGHLIISVEPGTAESVRALGKAVALARG
jgi:probable F420-dependent oxidoreductase